MSTADSLVHVALFTGGIDKHYAAGLSKSLAAERIAVELIGNSEMKEEQSAQVPNVTLVSLYETLAGKKGRIRKLLAAFRVYVRLMRYATSSSASVFHILWNYKLPVFDRTLLLLFYRLLGKRVVFTAHNVNAGARDANDSFLNRISLRIQYRLVDHIFVHTEKMKNALIEDFGVGAVKVSVIPFGTYDVVPQTTLTYADAKDSLGLRKSDRTILFFGRIVPYKGLDLLVNAFARIAAKNESYRLVIAGEAMKESEEQLTRIKQVIDQPSLRDKVIRQIRFIQDNEIEVFFKAADVLALPYTHIFQSGVLFMSYSFGLPVIATDVGSFAEDIVPGVSGYVCRANDPEDLARTIETFFESELFRTLEEQRPRIKDSVQASHSWEIAAARTREIYIGLPQHKNLQYST